MNSRRHFLQHASRWGLGAVAAGTGLYSVNGHSAAPAGFKALIVVHLNGGCDTHDVLIPLDGAYSDYAKARPSIAVARDQITALPGTHLGHTMGLNKAMAALLPLFTSQRLGFVVNTGALVKPTTTADVLNGRASLPPFLYSHPEQTQFVQGWMGDSDPSGWAGRAMEALNTDKSLGFVEQAQLRAGRNLVAVLGDFFPGRCRPQAPFDARGDQALGLRAAGRQPALDEQLVGPHDRAISSGRCPACTDPAWARRCRRPGRRSAR